jgi:biopolymer transport protein ExbD
MEGNSTGALSSVCYNYEERKRKTREDLVMVEMNYVPFYNVLLLFVLVVVKTMIKKERRERENESSFPSR